MSAHELSEDRGVDDVRASFARQALMTHLGAYLVRVQPGAVDVGVDFHARLTQQHGYFHGGVSTMLADTACGYAALTLAPAGSEVLTVGLSVNFLAPAAGERLLARARMLRAGRTLSVCRGEVYAVTQRPGGVGASDMAGVGEEVHVASVTATVMRIVGEV